MAADALERLRDQRIELGGVRECLLHQPELELERRAARPRHLVEHLRIIRRIHHHHYVTEVLRGRAQQARAADIDFFDQAVKRRIGILRRLPEWIEVDDDEIDWPNAVRTDRVEILWPAAASQDPREYGRVQRFDAAVHHLGKAGDV